MHTGGDLEPDALLPTYEDAAAAAGFVVEGSSLPALLPTADASPQAVRHVDALVWPTRYSASGHNDAVVPPPFLRLPLPDGVEDSEAISDWLGVIVMAPHYQTTHWALRFDRGLGIDALLSAVLDLGAALCNGTADSVVALKPQRHRGYAMVLAFPSVVSQLGPHGHVACVLDLSHVGGAYFATVLPALISYDDIESFVLPLISAAVDQFRFFLPGRDDPWPYEQDLQLEHGFVITVLEESRRLGASIRHAVGNLLDLPVEHLTMNACRMSDLDVQGSACCEVLQVVRLPSPDEQNTEAWQRRDIFVLCDMRALGLRPVTYFTHSLTVHVPPTEMMTILTMMSRILPILTQLTPRLMRPIFQASFFIFVPDYLPEVISLPVNMPATLAEVLFMIQEIRFDVPAGRFPQLIPTRPQLSDAFGCLLAIPAWPEDRAVVMFDLRLFNGALFASCASRAMRREDLLVLAGLGSGACVHVFVPSQPWALGPRQLVYLSHGDVISFVSYGTPFVPGADIEEMLHDPDSWEDDAVIPELDAGFCFLSDFDTFRLPVPPAGNVGLRQLVGESLQCAPHALTLRATRPTRVGHQHILVLDMRPILRGLDWRLLEHDRVSVRSLLDAFEPLCPSGFSVTVSGGREEEVAGELVIVSEDGQALSVDFEAILAPGQDEELALSHQGSDHESSPGDTDRHFRDADAEIEISSGSDARSRSPRGEATDLQGSDRWRAQAEVAQDGGCTIGAAHLLLLLLVFPDCGVSCASFGMHAVRSAFARFPPSVLTGFFVQMAFAIQVRACLGTLLSVVGCGRPLPTPCRATSALETHPVPGLAEYCVDGPTLLECSLQEPGNEAFLLSCTLLEVLVEHGQVADHPAAARSHRHVLTLDELLPAGPATEYIPSSKGDNTVGPEVFDLDVGQCQLPCSVQDLHALLGRTFPSELPAPPASAIGAEWGQATPYLAELAGLFWCALLALRMPFASGFVCRADNQAALFGAEGRIGMRKHPLAEAVACLHMALRILRDDAVRYYHVLGHSGDPANELADGLASLGAMGPPCSLEVSPTVFPSVQHDVLSWSLEEPESVLPGHALMAPFTRAFPSSEVSDGKCAPFEFACVSFNVLSLLEKDDCAVGAAAGLYGSAGRVALLATTLRDHKVFLVLYFLAGHAPHRMHDARTREAWWTETCQLCRQYGPHARWLASLDANCRVGDVETEHIGGWQADQQDLGGDGLHALLRQHDMWLPCSFQETMSGPGGTLYQKVSRELQRGDFICLPMDWRRCKVSARVEAAISAGHAVLDHLAARRLKAAFLSADAAEIHQAVSVLRHDLRNRLTGLRLARLRCAWIAWRGGPAFETLFSGPWLGQLRLSIGLFTMRIGVLGRVLRRRCRLDKRLYLEALADEVDGSAGAQAQCALKKADGTMCQSESEVIEQWRQHFANMEGGRVVQPDTLATSCLARQRSIPPAESLQVDDMPDLLQVLEAFRQVNPHKAAGQDCIPPALCKQCPGQLAVLFWPIVLKAMIHSSEPVGLKGGVLFHIDKPGVPDKLSLQSQRGILAQSIFEKILHKTLRRLVVGERVREAVVGGGLGDAPLEEVVRTLGLRDEDMQILCSYVQDEPALQSVQGHSLLQVMSREFHAHTWFALAGDPCLVQTSRGTRPGGCLADAMFSILFLRVLARRGDFREQGWCPEVCWTGSRELVSCPVARGLPKLKVQDIVYADDLATCATCSHAAELPRVVTRITGVTLDTLAGHGLSANIGPRKTAAMICPSGVGAKAVRTQIFTRDKGKIAVLLEHSSPVSLDAISTYKHLGASLSYSGSMLPEIRSKLGAARAAFREGQKSVFCSCRMHLRKRASLFRVHVLSVLLAGAGAWPELCCGGWRLFEQGVFAMYRKLLRIPHHEDQHVCKWRIVSLLGLPTPAELLHVERLRFLSQLVCAAPDEAWALLQNAPRALRAMWSAIAWFQEAIVCTTELGDVLANWSLWRDLIKSFPGRWKGLIKRAVAWHGARHAARADLEACFRSCWRPAPKPLATTDCLQHGCVLCKVAFCDVQSWAAHAAKSHKYRAHHRRYAVGVRCRACGSVFPQHRRLVQHLKISPRCCQAVALDKPGLLPALSLPEGPAQALLQPGGQIGSVPELIADYSRELLVALRATCFESDEHIFDTVASFIEPFPVLRQTLVVWVSELDDSDVKEWAVDVLSCWQVDLLCDKTPAAKKDADNVGVADYAFRPLIEPFFLSVEHVQGSALLAGTSSDLNLDRAFPVRPSVWTHVGFESAEVDLSTFSSLVVCFPAPPLPSLLFWEFPSCSLKALRPHQRWISSTLTWISAALEFARLGRFTALSFDLSFDQGGALFEWLVSSAAAAGSSSSLVVRFTSNSSCASGTF
ncbi:unnamed protein product [Symbiodinium sp. CCMP2592]|nr:unnamed protein product [Symbiodinium sp. CCMP2592]